LKLQLSDKNYYGKCKLILFVEITSATKTNPKRKNKKSIKVKTAMVKKPARRK
jgi:hypothetical protein